MKKSKRIMIANRGEIAVRIIRCCKELEIETVAIYSKADKNSLHVELADQAICIGDSPSSQSYLNIDAVLQAAKLSRADAIHPGYGFLSENAEFVRRCISENILFIGPSAEILEKMGDKIAARKLVSELGVPVIEGTTEPVKSKEEVYRIAEQIDYPILLKAAHGGGGKGMRVIKSSSEIEEAFIHVQNEAVAAFGNAALYIERYIQNARHIEVQVLADQSGNVIHLGERDCTIQRRHQKIIEESPCSFISDKIRERLYELAVMICQETKYTNAGTIEFLVDMDREKLYFIEMNTRLQVEHPVTELVTGVDIVAEQIRITNGESLSVKQNEVFNDGHAIECRINAEDPDNNFAPSPGKINHFILPSGFGIRVDTHAYSGYTVPPFYDSLIGKVIVAGKDRPHAIQRMISVLSTFQVSGINTTISFHLDLLKNSDFQDGNYNTQWLERVLKDKEL